jgi:hypothetical protein
MDLGDIEEVSDQRVACDPTRTRLESPVGNSLGERDGGGIVGDVPLGPGSSRRPSGMDEDNLLVRLRVTRSITKTVGIDRSKKLSILIVDSTTHWKNIPGCAFTQSVRQTGFWLKKKKKKKKRKEKAMLAMLAIQRYKCYWHWTFAWTPARYLG